MSIDLLEGAAAALGNLRGEVVFIGAATLALWITDPAAPELRPTADVDVVVEVTTRVAYNRFEQRLRDLGFSDEGTVVGRFLFGPDDRQIDVIPAEASILGFDNHWQQASVSNAVLVKLPSGTQIRALPPANLLATKLEAFARRGGGDYLAGHDFEDLVALIDGREELVDEIGIADVDLRSYIATELSRHVENPRAREAIAAHLEGGRNGRARSEEVVLPRLDRLIASSSIS